MATTSIQAIRQARGQAEQRRARQRRWLLGVGGALLLLTVLFVFVLPPLVQSRLERELAAGLGREVSVGPVRLNPLTLSFTSRDVRVLDPDGQPLVAWRRLHLNAQLSSWWRRAWVFRRIEVTEPLGRLIVQSDGSLNISDLLARFRPAPGSRAAEPARPIHIGELIVVSATFEFEDLAREVPFITTLGPVSFTLTGFATAEGDVAPGTFNAVSESGERLHWAGQFSAVPLRSEGEFRIEGLQLRKYGAYTRQFLAAELRDGQLSLGGRYELALGDGQQRLELIDGAALVENLKVVPHEAKEPAVEVKRLSLSDLDAQLAPLRLQLGNATLDGGRVALARAADGQIDLLALLRPRAAASAPAAGEPPAARVTHVQVNDFGFTWRDATVPRPATVHGVVESLELRDLGLPSTTPGTVAAQVRLQPEGRLVLDGQLQFDPLRLDAATTAEQVPLSLASPYVEAQVPVQLAKGAAHVQGRVRVAPSGEAPAVGWSGSLQLTDLAVHTTADSNPLASAERISLEQISAALGSTTTAEVGALHVLAPQLRVLVRPDGALNLAALAATPASPAAAPSGAPPALAVRRTRIERGSLVFDDRSVQPAVHARVDELDVTVGPLASTQLDRAEASLTARVQGVGRAELAGRINPLNPAATTEFTVKVRDVDLQAAGPYLAKYAGYQLERGQLALDLRYQIADRTIQAQNLVRLHQFTLGARSNSPEATNLPVPLAVALLKDRQGLIEVDLPIEGNLDDPAFRIGRVVGRVLLNLLTRAATSPFALLGALVPGAADADPSLVTFAPGDADLLPPEQAKLTAVARALQERPALRLEIAGAMLPAEDRAGLQRLKLEAEVLRRWSEQPSAVTAAGADQEPTAAEREQVLRRWHLATNPQALVLPPEAAARLAEASRTSAGDENSQGVWRRLARALGFGGAEAGAAETAATNAAVEAALFAAGPELPAIEEALAATLPVEDGELQALAQQRAEHVRQTLVAAGVDASRVFLGNPVASGREVKLQLR